MPGALLAISVFELHVPEARSLKEKRSVVKSLIERIEARHRVCLLESDFQDLHQRSEITLALLGHNQPDVDRVLARIRDTIDGHGGCYLTYWEPQFLEAGR
jgi:uncharacterized protein YlxP (DUF503 family)